MKTLSKIFAHIVCAIVVLAFASPSLGQSFDGAWSITSATSGDDTNDNPQASLFIFHDGYYSWLSLNGTDERPKYNDGESRATLSHEKLQAIVVPVISNSGTYSVDGNTITLSPSVAISPNLMDGGQIMFEFELSKKELVLRGDTFSMTLARQK
jgi:hypothetical protein